MSGWYVKRDDKKYGPYSSTQLVEMAKQGQVLPLDWVAQGEGEKWIPASQVKGLFPARATVVPPPIPAAVVPLPPATGKGPPPPPVSTPTGGTAVEVVDSQHIPANPVAMAFLGKLLGAKGPLPARIAMPVLWMLLVIGSTLCLSLCGVYAALDDGFFGLHVQLLIALALFHSVMAIVAVVMTARLQHYVAAPAAAILTMTVFGWYVFALGWPLVWILGLMAGISIGAWALFTFHSPDVKAMFADAAKPGPLDRYSTPALAGAAGGLLAVILGVGGLLYAVTGSKTKNAASGNSGSSGGNRQMKSRGMPEPRQMPPPRQMKSRTSGTADEDDIGSEVAVKQVTANDLNGRSFAQIERLLGQPTEVYRSKKKQNLGLAIWATGDNKYAVVSFAESIDGSSQTLVLTREVNRTRSIVDNMKRAIDK